jgi:hypothetical protein
MSKIIIDKDIPIPRKNLARKNPARKYPFLEMKVGDSFIACDYDRAKAQSLTQYSNLTGVKFMNGAKFICRKTEDNKIRIWRVS